MFGEVFQLFGTIAINTSEAIKDLDHFSQKLAHVAASTSIAGLKISESFHLSGETIQQTAMISKQLEQVSVLAVKTSADFDNMMSSVAATSSVMTTKLVTLQSFTSGIGASAANSAEEAADALGVLEMSGMGTEQILGELPNMFNRSAAGSTDLMGTAESLSDRIQVMELQVKQAGETAHELSTAMIKTNTVLETIAKTFAYTANMASQLNSHLKDVVVMSAMMAEAGLKCQQVGMAMNDHFRSLVAPALEVAAALNRISMTIISTESSMSSMLSTMLKLASTSQSFSTTDAFMQKEAVAGKKAMLAWLMIVKLAPNEFMRLSAVIAATAISVKADADQINNGVNDAFTRMTAALNDVKQEIAQVSNPIKDVAFEVVAYLARAFSSLDSETKNVILTIGVFVNDIIQTIFALDSFIDKVEELLNFPEKVMKLVTRLSSVTGILGKVGGTIANLAGLLTNPWVIGIALIVSLIIGLVYIIVTNWDAIKEVTERVFSAIGAFLSNIWANIKQFILTTVASIVADLIIGMQRIRTTVSTVMNAVFKIISITWNNVLKTIKKVLKAIPTAISKQMSKAVLSLSKFGTQFASIGKHIINGLINGMKSRMKSVMKTVSNIGGNIKREFKKLFKIKSPSKVFFEYGQFIGEGLEIGMQQYLPKIENATKAMANKVKDGFDAIGQLGLTVSGKAVVEDGSEPLSENIMGQGIAKIAGKIKESLSMLNYLGLSILNPPSSEAAFASHAHLMTKNSPAPFTQQMQESTYNHRTTQQLTIEQVKIEVKEIAEIGSAEKLRKTIQSVAAQDFFDFAIRKM